MAPPRKIDALIPLQELDLQIHRLKVQQAEKPRQLASTEEKCARAKATLEAVQGEIKALKLEGARRELSVKEFDEKVNKLQTQSMTAKKNDEYQAFQKEISGLKAEKARVEDGLLDIYLQVEEKGKLEKVRQEELKQAEAEHAANRKKVDGEVAALNRDVEEQLAKRAGLVAGVDKEMLRLYQRVLDAKEDGLALSPAVKYETVEDEGKVTYWQCEGCGIGLNMQDVNLLMMGRDVHFCRNCSRILYLKPA
jgi:predicted  nucleic acid-binding Zn-ribbon protein